MNGSQIVMGEWTTLHDARVTGTTLSLSTEKARVMIERCNLERCDLSRMSWSAFQNCRIIDCVLPKLGEIGDATGCAIEGTCPETFKAIY